MSRRRTSSAPNCAPCSTSSTARRANPGMTEAAVRAALARVIDPEIRRPITELDMVGDVQVDGARASVTIKLTIVGCPAPDRIERDVREAVAPAGIGAAGRPTAGMTPEARRALTERLQGGRTRTRPCARESLTRVIAVTSGKGGVGKSTVTANLAVALA